PWFWLASGVFALLLSGKLLVERIRRFPDGDEAGGGSEAPPLPLPALTVWEKFARRAGPWIDGSLLVAWVALAGGAGRDVGLSLTFILLFLVACISIAREVLKVQKARRTSKENLARAEMPSYLPTGAILSAGLLGTWLGWGDPAARVFWMYVLGLGIAYLL